MDSGFHVVDSTFQKPGFRIPQAKILRFHNPDSLSSQPLMVSTTCSWSSKLQSLFLPQILTIILLRLTSFETWSSQLNLL